jgi:transcriptional antiterminator RfaH
VPWYVAHTHAKREPLAEVHLAHQRFECFLPRILHTYRRGQRLMPLFPGYIFVAFDITDPRWRTIRHTPGIKNLFMMPASDAHDSEFVLSPVSDQLIEDLRQQVILSPSNPRIPVIAPGTRVRITKGHFENREGICAWSSTKRVALLLSVMGGQVECTFDRNSVELIV